MKRRFILIFTLLFLLTLPASPQIEKGDFSISLGANFNQSTQTAGSSSGNKSLQISISPAVGYFITDKLTVGAGISLGWTKENAGLHIPALVAEIDIESTNKTRDIIPFIYAGYYWEIFKNFYFSPTVQFSIGPSKVSSITNTRIKTLLPITIGEITIPSISYDMPPVEETTDYTYIGAFIMPEFSYLFSRHFSIYLNCGRFGYSSLKSEKDRTTNWIANINPTEWNVGCRIIL